MSMITKTVSLTAKQCGINVIGIEGKGLEHDQHSPLYNKSREGSMIGTIQD